MATVELSRAELALLVRALRPIANERTGFQRTPTLDAIDARALSDKLEFARGPFLKPVA